MCDHRLEFKSWKYNDPKPILGTSYSTATRHLRILKRDLETILGRSARREDPPWEDLPKHQWELLWKGEEALRKYGPILWEAGHKTIALFPGDSKEPLHRVIRQAGDGSQTQHAQIPVTKRVPTLVRQTLQAYLNLVDWEHILGGGSREDSQDWATSSEIIE